MFYFGLPFLFFESDLFNPKFYAYRSWNRRLGDLCQYSGFVSLAFYGVSYYYRSRL